MGLSTHHCRQLVDRCGATAAIQRTWPSCFCRYSGSACLSGVKDGWRTLNSSDSAWPADAIMEDRPDTPLRRPRCNWVPELSARRCSCRALLDTVTVRPRRWAVSVGSCWACHAGCSMGSSLKVGCRMAWRLAMLAPTGGAVCGAAGRAAGRGVLGVGIEEARGLRKAHPLMLRFR
jgi:hypothetical protein